MKLGLGLGRVCLLIVDDGWWEVMFFGCGGVGVGVVLWTCRVVRVDKASASKCKQVQGRAGAGEQLKVDFDFLFVSRLASN